jgi:hypothetical protein
MARERLMKTFERHSDYYKKHVNEDLEALADSMVNEMFESELPEEKAKDDDAIDPSKEFEQGSMFDPT